MPVTEQPSARDWDKLTRFAKANFPKLYVMLRNYNVSERELRICLLTRLFKNFTGVTPTEFMK